MLRRRSDWSRWVRKSLIALLLIQQSRRPRRPREHVFAVDASFLRFPGF
jgi:hypothetical protein